MSLLKKSQNHVLAFVAIGWARGLNRFLMHGAHSRIPDAL